MTLDEYVDSQKKKVKAFARFWELNHDEEPENFQLEMDHSDWDEQFHLITLEEMEIAEED